MAFNINEFAAAGLPLGGARPSLFQVTFDTPQGIQSVAARVAFTASAAALPGMTTGVIPIRYFGREVKFAGNKTFDPWIVTILNDEDFQVRNALEQWSNAINLHAENIRDASLATPTDYRTTATVSQYSKVNKTVLRTYELINAWPSNIGTIDLDWENSDQIERFTVEFTYDYWRPASPGITGTFAV